MGGGISPQYEIVFKMNAWTGPFYAFCMENVQLFQRGVYYLKRKVKQ